MPRHWEMLFDLHVAASEAVQHDRGWVHGEHPQDDWGEVTTGVQTNQSILQHGFIIILIICHVEIFPQQSMK